MLPAGPEIEKTAGISFFDRFRNGKDPKKNELRDATGKGMPKECGSADAGH